MTYREYDYGRKDKNGNERELHIDKALKVTNFNKFIPITFKHCLGKSEYFTVQKYEIDGEKLSTSEKAFHCLTCVKGNGFIEDMEIRKGDSYFVPANYGEYSVFTFGMQYWNAKTTRESCAVVKTQFLSYDEIWRAKPTINILEIAVDCADGNRYFIDGVSINDELRENLSLLSENESITLLIHPNSNTIVEFSSSHGSLLIFDETINDLDGEATGFLILGLFMYFCALVGLYYIVFHLVRKSKHRS